MIHPLAIINFIWQNIIKTSARKEKLKDRKAVYFGIFRHNFVHIFSFFEYISKKNTRLSI